MNKQLHNIVFAIGAVLLVLGAVLHILGKVSAPYIFSVGVLGFVVVRMLNPIKNTDFRVKRLQAMQAIGALLLIVSAYLMFTKSNAWALTLVIVAVIELVVSFRMPKRSED
jgi:uncharacterized membrane protein